MGLECKEQSDCKNYPFFQHRSWIIWKQNGISGTYVYFRSDLYKVTTVQTSACFVHVTVTVVTCHEPAGDIQYIPTPTLHCVLWSAHTDQDSRCIQVRHTSNSDTLVTKQTSLPKTHFKIQPPYLWCLNTWHTQPNLSYRDGNRSDSYKNK